MKGLSGFFVIIPTCPLDASPVVSGREDCLPAANGISARQPFVIGRKEAIPACIGDCFSAFAMTVHGALSCNNGHKYEERHVEMPPSVNS
jgi:hypothetical protein